MKKLSAILKLIILIAILAVIPVYVYFCHHDILDKLSDIAYLEALLAEHKTESIFIYVGVQILQIVFCFLPGQAIQLAGGYMFGFWIGYLLTIVGAGLGTILSYYIARFLGRDAVNMIFGEEKIRHFTEKMRGKKGFATLIILYLVPGFPKDMLSYASGVTDFKIIWLLVISLVARSPAMMGSLLIGDHLVKGNYTVAIVIAAVAVVLFIIGMLTRNKLMKAFDRFYDKVMKL